MSANHAVLQAHILVRQWLNIFATRQKVYIRNREAYLSHAEAYANKIPSADPHDKALRTHSHFMNLWKMQDRYRIRLGLKPVFEFITGYCPETNREIKGLTSWEYSVLTAKAKKLEQEDAKYSQAFHAGKSKNHGYRKPSSTETSVRVGSAVTPN